MKFVVSKGNNIDDAILEFSQFINNECQEYTVLKGDLSIYLTLKDKENHICPLNEMEYRIIDGKIIDVLKHQEEKASLNILEQWYEYVDFTLNKVKDLEEEIEKDNEYLDTAEEKNRKAKNIEKRKKENEKHKEEFQDILNFFKVVTAINEYVSNGDFEIVHVKGASYNNSDYYSKKYYNRIIKTFIVFESENYSGYFDGRVLRSGILRIENL